MSDRNRDKVASSNWEFPNVLLSRALSFESLDLSSAFEVSRFYFDHK